MTAAWELRLLVARNHLARGGVIVLAGQLTSHQVVGLPFHNGAKGMEVWHLGDLFGHLLVLSSQL